MVLSLSYIGTMYSDDSRFRDLFARGSRIGQGDGKSFSESDLRWLHLRRARDGVQKFKWRALGFFGVSVVNSLDEMAELFSGLGFVSSVEEGREVTRSLGDVELEYGEFIDKYLVIERVKSFDGSWRYRVQAYWNPVTSD